MLSYIELNWENQYDAVRTGEVDVQAGKTGFIRSAGYCLATLLRLPQGGPSVAVVVLGAKSNAGRFWETRHLFNWLSEKAGEFFTPPEVVDTLVRILEPQPGDTIYDPTCGSGELMPGASRR